MANITDKAMKAKPGQTHKWLSEVAIWGHGTLLARITPSGDRLFYFQYTTGAGKRYALPIGTYGNGENDGTMSLSDARHRAMELACLHKAGIKNIREHLDAAEASLIEAHEAELSRLATDKAAALADRAREANRKTVKDLFDHWAKVDLVNRKDGGKEVRRMFEKDVLPLLGTLAVVDIKKGHITEITDAMLARGVNRAAKIAFSLMRQMFRFAVDRDLIDHDPSASIRKAKIGGKDVERDRVLSDDEIRTLAKKAPEAGLLITSESAMWIALSTCCRIGELLSSRWEHIDLQQRIWQIPAESSKNGKPHTVYLSNFALFQFEKVKSINGHSKWCYPNTDDSGPVCSKTVTKQLGDRQRQPGQAVMSRRSAKAHSLVLSGGKWTPHDLRRTGATLMVALGVIPEVAERCLNHTEDNKIKRIYQRHSYTAEMSAAWGLLGQRLEELTALVASS